MISAVKRACNDTIYSTDQTLAQTLLQVWLLFDLKCCAFVSLTENRSYRRSETGEQKRQKTNICGGNTGKIEMETVEDEIDLELQMQKIQTATDVKMSQAS